MTGSGPRLSLFTMHAPEPHSSAVPATLQSCHWLSQVDPNVICPHGTTSSRPPLGLTLLCPSRDLCRLGDVLSVLAANTSFLSNQQTLISVVFIPPTFHVFWVKDSRAASWLVMNLLIPALGDSTTEGPRAAYPVSQTLTSQTHSDWSFSTHNKFIPQGPTCIIL